MRLLPLRPGAEPPVDTLAARPFMALPAARSASDSSKPPAAPTAPGSTDDARRCCATCANSWARNRSPAALCKGGAAVPSRIFSPLVTAAAFSAAAVSRADGDESIATH